MIYSEKKDWLTTSRAAKALDIHPVTLHRKRDDGYFVEGIHFIKMGKSKNSQFIWNLEKVLKVFNYWKRPESQINGK